MSITQTINQINEGFSANCPCDILPIYIDGELANRLAYRTYNARQYASQAKRDMQRIAYITGKTLTLIGKGINHACTADFTW